MARYRKGDRYLSEEEYHEETDKNWTTALFIIGAIASGYLTIIGLQSLGMPKWVNFSAIIFSSLLGGSVLGSLHKQIRLLISVLIVALFLFIIGSCVWSIS